MGSRARAHRSAQIELQPISPNRSSGSGGYLEARELKEFISRSTFGRLLLAAIAQEEKPVEHVEDLAGWLDGAHNRKVAQELLDHPSAS